MYLCELLLFQCKKFCFLQRFWNCAFSRYSVIITFYSTVYINPTKKLIKILWWATLFHCSFISVNPFFPHSGNLKVLLTHGYTYFLSSVLLFTHPDYFATSWVLPRRRKWHYSWTRDKLIKPVDVTPQLKRMPLMLTSLSVHLSINGHPLTYPSIHNSSLSIHPSVFIYCEQGCGPKGSS